MLDGFDFREVEEFLWRAEFLGFSIEFCFFSQ